MAKRKRKPKWSLLLIRGPDRSVRQFHFSKKTAVALPAAAVLTVAGCVAGLEWRSQQRIDQWESRMNSQTAALEQTLSGKDGEIAALRKELSRLQAESDEVNRRMDQVHELESKLKAFMDKYGNGASASGTKAKSASAHGEVVAASYAPLGKLDAIRDADGEFDEISRLLDGLAATLDAAKRKAEMQKLNAESSPTSWPTVSRRLTSGFGYRKDPFTGRSSFHAGIDIAGETGDPVYAAGAGTVKEAGFQSSRGNYIVIAHAGGVESVYMHLSKIAVRAGEKVERGETIGRIGNTGRSTGPHLHFEVTLHSEPVSPLRYLRLVQSS